jgi:hypothetical protein
MSVLIVEKMERYVSPVRLAKSNEPSLLMVLYLRPKIVRDWVLYEWHLAQKKAYCYLDLE